MFQRSLLGSGLRAELYRQASRALGSGSGRATGAFLEIPLNPTRSFSGLNKNSLTEKHPQSSILGNLTKLGLVRLPEKISSPYALSFKSFIHSGKPAEDEAGKTPPRSMDYVQELLQVNRNDANGLPPLNQRQVDSFQGLPLERGNAFNIQPPLYHHQLESNAPQLESNADIVHIKLLRNNAFVTVTDSKGNKKFGVSAGQLAGKGGKLTRYSGEAAAEHVGRKVRQMKTRSVVVKVNGFTFFRRKKDAILSFKDGYSNSRGGMNPVVYLEDTTRKPHNGCRLPKKRRI